MSPMTRRAAPKSSSSGPRRREQDVVGRDVAVVALRRVHHRRAHRAAAVSQARSSASLGALAERGERRLQRRSLVVRHHHVGGAVLFPEAVDLDQRRMVEAGEQARLVDEALQAGAEGVEMALRLDDDRRRAGDARGHRRRHVLLDRDLALQRVVPGEVDDAEAAFADQAGDLVVAQLRAERQRVAGSGAAAGALALGLDAGLDRRRVVGRSVRSGLVVVGAAALIECRHFGPTQGKERS